MNAEELNRLIDKYYNGDSTEEDERVLKDYFSQKNILAGYETEKDIFGYFKSQGRLPEPTEGFEARILAAIDYSESRKGSVRKRKYIIPYLSAAAGLLILFGSYFFFVNKSEVNDTFTDPEIAYAETMKILMNISYQLNHGASALKPVAKIEEMKTRSFAALNKSSKIVEKNMKELEYLRKAINQSDVPVLQNQK